MQIKPDMRNFFRMFGFVKPYAIRYVISTFLYSVQSFYFSFVVSVFLASLTAAVIARDMSGVYRALFLLAGLLVAFMIAIGFAVYVHVVTLFRAERDFKAKLFSAFVRGNIEEATLKHSGEGIAAINTDADTAAGAYGDALTPLLFNILAIVFSFVTIFAVDYRLGIGAIGVGAIALAIQAGFAPALARLGSARLDANAGGVKAMSNIFAGGLAIRALGRQRKALMVFDKENGKLMSVNLKEAFIGMWQALFTTLQGWLSLVFVFGFGGWLVATERLELHLLMMVLGMVSAITDAMSGIGTNWANLQPPIVAAGRVFSIIDSVPEEGTVSQAGKTVQWDGRYDIMLSGVNFAYKGSEENALTDINLEIRENEMVAFVGASGSGKSTLLRTIIGMYQRPGLAMSIGNLQFADGDIMGWREHFAYVDQSCKLFDMTIAENIAMGLKGDADADAIKKSASQAFADEFITELSEGYDSSCGEKGASLSGGQKQRIAIARALIKGAPVMVFDEATSALDSESELRIMESIETMRKDHTILITTHNLRNVVSADKIVVMRDGRVVEVGTHDELMTLEGVYLGLVRGEG